MSAPPAPPPDPTKPGYTGFMFCQAHGWEMWIRHKMTGEWAFDPTRQYNAYRHLFHYRSLARVIRHPEGGFCIRFYEDNSLTKPTRSTLRFKTRAEAEHAFITLQLARANPPTAGSFTGTTEPCPPTSSTPTCEPTDTGALGVPA